LTDRHDVQAWEEFVAIYEPVVYRLARARGFQEADARDVVQEVLLTISKAIEQWQPNPEQGRFRDWLYRVARNLMVNHLTRRATRASSPGGTDIWQLFNAQEDPAAHDCQVTQAFELEYRREMFRQAAARVKKNVKASTWEAFQLLAIEQLPAVDVASRLRMSEGAVLVAKCRVLSRLRELIQLWQSEMTGPRSEEDVK
jgi:RNA polymerase sigma factor (sigma-70 family)